MSRTTAITGALTALLIAGCGSSAPSGVQHVSAAQTAAKLAGSPPPLKAVHAQANQLLPGGGKALDARLSALRGYPVVINFWGSWCGPCRDEFPIFQKAGLAVGKRVAFLGVDVQDAADAAAKFLRQAPVTYPSYSDPQQKIASSYGLIGTPSTAFVDRNGKRAFLHQGPYRSVSELESDIKRYTGA